MGVNHLWSILAPVKAHKPLKSLKGQTLAVDISVWICESASALQGAPVIKPHLRNLFFRITNLTQMGVGLIFVLDGEPPELKWEEMERRTQARFDKNEGKGGKWWMGRRKKGPVRAGCAGDGAKRKKKERKRFKFVLKECAEMLAYLGIPCVQAAGEAEAMCALLNQQGLVDACLTEDGDVFLYGARTVYKNFTLNTKDPHVECYSMEDIETSLGLDQKKLIGLALLLGCDYTPGVTGVGPKHSLNLLGHLGPDVDILDRFRNWADRKTSGECMAEALPKKSPHCTRCSHVGSGREHKVYGCALCKSDVNCQPKSAKSVVCTCPWHTSSSAGRKATVEQDVMKKACANVDFPNELVVDEFLSIKDKCPQEKPTWKRPQLICAQAFISSKLEWPEDYTVEKVFPLVTLWDLKTLASGKPFDSRVHLRPSAVVKKRVRQGVACVEIQWQTDIPHSESGCLTTIEREDLFQKAFPELMAVYEEIKASKTKPKRKKPVKTTRKESSKDDTSEKQPPASGLDSLASAIAHLTLTPRRSPSKLDINKRFVLEDDSMNSILIDGFQPSGYASMQEPHKECNELCKNSSSDNNSLPSDVRGASSRARIKLDEGLHPGEMVKLRNTSKTCTGIKCLKKQTISDDSGGILCALLDSHHNLTPDSQIVPTDLNQNVSTIPLRRNMTVTKVPICLPEEDPKEEPLPLSERLRLKKVLGKKRTVDVPASLSSSSEEEEEEIDITSSSDPSSPSEQCHGKELDFRDSLNMDSMLLADSSSPLYHQVNLSSMVDRFLLKKAQDADLQDFSSTVMSDFTEDTPVKESKLSGQLQSQVLPKTNDKRTIHIDKALPGVEHPQLMVETLSGFLADPDKASVAPPPLGASPSVSTSCSYNANFSLGFELTKLLLDDESLLPNNSLEEDQPQPRTLCRGVEGTSKFKVQTDFLGTPEEPLANDSYGFDSMHYEQASTEMPKYVSPELLPSVLTSGMKHHLNFSLKFELTDILNGDETFGLLDDLSTNKNGVNPQKSMVVDETPIDIQKPPHDKCSETISQRGKDLWQDSGDDHKNKNSSPLTVSPACKVDGGCTLDENEEGSNISATPFEISSRDASSSSPLCKTLAPSSISVDTPIIKPFHRKGAQSGSSKSSNKSQAFENHSKTSKNTNHHSGKVLVNPREGSSWNSPGRTCECKENQPNLSLACKGKNKVSHNEDLSPNTSQCQSSLKPLAHISHVQENSPVSLLDRLKRKHKNEREVLSAVLSMQSGGKVYKGDKLKKTTSAILDDIKYK